MICLLCEKSPSDAHGHFSYTVSYWGFVRNLRTGMSLANKLDMQTLSDVK